MRRWNAWIGGILNPSHLSTCRNPSFLMEGKYVIFALTEQVCKQIRNNRKSFNPGQNTVLAHSITIAKLLFTTSIKSKFQIWCKTIKNWIWYWNAIAIYFIAPSHYIEILLHCTSLYFRNVKFQCISHKFNVKYHS